MHEYKQIPCTIMRGGTSKGLYFLEKNLPVAGKERDQLLLRIMGSPDIKQIDGLGGATSVTSKIAIISPSTREGVDVDYTFGQVGIDKPLVDYRGNCGNLSSGVGPFAIENGLVKAIAPMTKVRIYNTNTQKVLLVDVKTPNGKVSYDGDYVIAGVPGTAAPIRITFCKPSGTIFNKVLPTGNTRDIIEIPDWGSIEVSIVDVTNLLVFVKANDIGMTGEELPTEINGNQKLLTLLELIRGTVGQKLKLVKDYRQSAWESPAIPKMTVVAAPDDYVTEKGQPIAAGSIDLLGRMMSMQKAHGTYAFTGAMCTAAAAAIPGTVVNQVMRTGADWQRIRIGHPDGVIEAGVEFTKDADGSIIIHNTYGYRTARLLMKGTVFY
jgi:2-methylaconitate cis-trans-isomerase PrpF